MLYGAARGIWAGQVGGVVSSLPLLIDRRSSRSRPGSKTSNFMSHCRIFKRDSRRRPGVRIYYYIFITTYYCVTALASPSASAVVSQRAEHCTPSPSAHTRRSARRWQNVLQTYVCAKRFVCKTFAVCANLLHTVRAFPERPTRGCAPVPACSPAAVVRWGQGSRGPRRGPAGPGREPVRGPRRRPARRSRSRPGCSHLADPFINDGRSNARVVS